MTDRQTVSESVGTKLLFENERVRVWDLRLEPGESTGMHRHSTDYFYVVIGDGSLKPVKRDAPDEPTRFMLGGEVHYREVDGEDVHAAVNTGETPWRNIVVELKD